MGFEDVEREGWEVDPASHEFRDVVDGSSPGQEFFCKGTYSLDQRNTVNPLLVLDPKEFTGVDCHDFSLPGARVPVDKNGTEGYVVTVSKRARTAVVAVMEDVAARFPRLGDVKFVDVDLDRFGTAPYLN
ncbi:MAG: hypothetical protein WC604_02410 [Candidatus Gracilibacteria bacterium]